MTAEEMVLQEKENPSFDPEGRFVAELEQKPVGVVHANVEKLREERTGFVRFDVILGSRGRGVERQLVETALKELKARGMATAQVTVDSRELDYIRLLQELNFKQVRLGSFMEMELANIPQGIGKDEQIAIRALRKDREEDLKLWTWLLNETFKEHFNFRPNTPSPTRRPR